MIRIGIRLDDNGIRVNAVSEGDDGETVVKVHRNKRRKMALSASIHLPIATTCPGRTDSVAWGSKGMRSPIRYSSPMWSRAEKVVRVQLYLSASTAMMIRMRLERMIDGYGKGCVSAEEIFQTSSTYMMVNVNGHLYRSRMTKEVESMFEFPGMDAGNPEKHDEFD